MNENIKSRRVLRRTSGGKAKTLNQPQSPMQPPGVYVPAFVPIDATKTCTSAQQTTPSAEDAPKPAPLQVLEPDFTSDGYDFHQLEREVMIAVFEKRKRGHSKGSYEVVIIQHKPARNVFGTPMPERETMPSLAQWGEAGWTEMTLEGAGKRYNALVEQQKKGSF